MLTPSIGPFDDNRSIKSWSSVSIKIGASVKGLSWTIITYAHNLFGITSV